MVLRVNIRYRKLVGTFASRYVNYNFIFVTAFHCILR